MENKKDFLRKFFKEKRNNLDQKFIKQKSLIISNKVINIFQKISILNNYLLKIMLYSSFMNEVDVKFIFNFCKDNFSGAYFPKIENNEISIVWINKLNSFIKNNFKILEPVGKSLEKFDINKNIFNIIIVPGIIFDKDGNRIGFGKGFYDRFLKKIKDFYIENNLYDYFVNNFLIIGICYDFQILDDILLKKYQINKKEIFFKSDFQMDIVITDLNIYFGQFYRRRQDEFRII